MRRRLFTFYCYEHRDQVVQGPSPQSIKVLDDGSVLFETAPTCPVCSSRMYYVPNGGTEVPEVKLIKPKVRSGEQ